MAANTQPIFSNQGSIAFSAIVIAANLAMDGTGTINTVMTGNAAGNAAGNFIQKLIARPVGTNAASVLRVFANNGGVNTIATNNALIAEITLPASTLNQTAAMIGLEIPLNFVLPANYKLNIALGTAVAAGWVVTAIGGQY